MDILGFIIINDWFLLFCSLIFALYLYSTWRFDFWKKQGVPGPKPLPFFLNYKYLIKEGFKWEVRLVKEYGKTVGIFEGRNPVLITTDDDILREVLVKQFPNFSNRRFMEVPEKSGFNKSVVILNEENGWNRIRNLMSPTFSSGKLKQFTAKMNECSIMFVQNDLGAISASGKIVNLKRSFADIAMSLIATVAFGIDMKDKETYEEFHKMGERVMHGNQGAIKMTLQFINFIAPKPTKWVTKALDIDIMDFGPFQYFGKIVDQILETRKKGDPALDFIQLMANAHNDDESDRNREGMTREEIVANGITFFLGGFDTMSGGLAVVFHQLALNPGAQEKAFAEVATILDKKNQIDYDDLPQLKYLDWCINESMRMIPPAFRIERLCKDDITIKGINIAKGTIICIPLINLHHDPERWDNPEEFRPERFSEEEKKDRSPYSWMPFGYGQRNCIAMRLALMELKIVAAHMLYNFRVEKCDKTMIPFEHSNFGVINEGMEVNLIKRSKT